MRRDRDNIQATAAEWAQHEERCHIVLAAIPGARRFEDELPTGDHVCVGVNRDGEITRLSSDLNSLHRFIALYGVPTGCWVQS